MPANLDEHLAALLIPGAGATEQARREAFRAMYEYLYEHGRSRKQDLLEHAYSETLDYADANSF